ncbi:MAG: ABC transporter permease [Peptococcaceae bacterium]|nr:ABC transporter permease [Peptococcaceae bacterium]
METMPGMFKPLAHEQKRIETAALTPARCREGSRPRFKLNKQAVAGLAIIIPLTAMALIGPYLSGHTCYEQNLLMANRPPGADHWFGTDALGRDLFTRVWYGARISLAVGLVTSLTCTVFGSLYGGISGYIGGRVDEIMMRLVEVLCCVPFLLYVILLVVLFEPGLKAILLALGLVYWLTVARIVRGQVLVLKEQEYVLAARLLGAGSCRLLLRHLLPNTMGPVIVTMTLLIPEAIFTEAFLSFLGLGVSAPAASWGVLASEGMRGLRNYPWQLFFPALFISLTMLAFNSLGDGLRDALDPRMHR